MAKKPFEIQGSDLTLGGVNLQAGTTGVVIPGVTQASNYRVEEVEDRDDQTLTFQAPPIVIDYVTFTDYDDNGTSTGRAEYIVEELDDDDYIEDIEVTDQGSYTAQESDRNDGNDLYAYVGSAGNPFASFVAADWEQIPFRPKMRAGEIENVGGAGGIGNLGIGDNDETILSDDGNKFLNFNGFNNNLIIGTNNTKKVVVSIDDGGSNWEFGADGSIQFPDGSVQTTAYTGQSSGSSSGVTRFVAVNDNGTVYGSTDGETWTEYDSSMTSIGRVAVGPTNIVYTANSTSGNGDSLWYTTAYNVAPTEVQPPENVVENYNEVKYFSSIGKYVAVGYVSEGGDFPILLHSSDGVTWTRSYVSEGFMGQIGFTGNAEFQDIAENDLGFFITSTNSDLGGFFLENITDALDGTTVVEQEDNYEDVVWINAAGFEFSGWHVIDNDNDWYYNANEDPRVGTFTLFTVDDLDPVFEDAVGYSDGTSEIVVGDYNGVPTIVAGTGDGQILYWPAEPAGPFVVVPKPYTATITAWTSATQSVITITGETGSYNEKFTVTGSSVTAYNGTYYINTNNNKVYTDRAMTVPFNTSGLAAFTGTATLTWSHGQYIDALHYSNGIFYMGNDDEEFFVSTDGGETWTETDSFTVGSETYINDIDSYTTPGISNRLVNGDKEVVLNTAGDLTLPGNIRSENDISIEVNLTDSTLRRWTFNEDGTLTFPDGTIQSTAGDAGLVESADGTLQAQVTSNLVTTLADSLTNGRPNWLTITPRSPDRNNEDSHYGFSSDGMWFRGDTEETEFQQPAYPIHTTNSFPADATAVVEFSIAVVSGLEDWSVCVYPADGIPHWSWEPHPSRIAAIVDTDDEEGAAAQAELNGLTGSSNGVYVAPPGAVRARFTYNPLAEMSIFELLDADGVTTSRCELPGRLAKGQDYMIGFDADWDNAASSEESYFTNLSITVGDTGVTKTTEFSLNGEVKLPSTVKGFINIQAPWANNQDQFEYHTVVAHNGYAYMGGENSWAGLDNNTVRLDKYSLTTGELVWTRTIGAGRNAEFDISWTGGVYTITGFTSRGEGYQIGEILYINGDEFTGGQIFANRATVTVTDVSPDNGSIQSATITGTAPSGSGTVAGATETNDDAQGMPISIKYDTVNDELVMLNHLYTDLGDVNDNNWERAVVLRINPVSGDVTSNVTLTDQGDIYAYDVAVHPTTGATAVVGEKHNEFRSFGTLTMLRKGNGYFDILKSSIDAEYWPGNSAVLPFVNNEDFWVQGTGIASKQSVSFVNGYEGLTGTTRQGTGATFNVIANAGDPGVYSISLSAGGTNYRVGHKIKILGTSLGGTTPSNDLTITIDSVNNNTNGIIESLSWSGTADGGVETTYNAVSGTNFEVGSGLTVDINVDPVTGSREAFVNQAGSNYVANDVIIIAGTEFANGTTPANNVEVTVVSVVGSGSPDSLVTSGTTPTNAIRLSVEGVDFTTVGGAWTMKQNLGGEAFVWTAGWDKAIGGSNTDKFHAVTYSKDGASIYAVGEGRYDVDFYQSLVVKYASNNGTIEFSRFLNTDDYNSYATSVATIGTDDIIVSGYEAVNGSNQYKMFVARLSSSGSMQWKNFYYNTYGSYSSLERPNGVVVDSDDNIYVTLQHRPDVSNNTYQTYGLTVIKLDQHGRKLWSRCISSGPNDSYLGIWNGNRWSSLDGNQLVVAGYTLATEDNYWSGLWASFPTDGFTYFGGEDDFVQQGAFRFSQGAISAGESASGPAYTFTPSVQPPTITAVSNLKKFATRTPEESLPQHLHKIVDPEQGGLVFGDGTRQTTAADRVPQIRADNDYWITANDSGKHIYFSNNSGTVRIPNESDLDLPVGFTVTIVNYTGSNCYIRLESGGPAGRGTILGAGRNLSTVWWGMPDSGSGSMATLIKLQKGVYVDGGYSEAPVWMISGPSDLFDDN